jgi:hypothetical protein
MRLARGSKQPTGQLIKALNTTKKNLLIHTENLSIFCIVNFRHFAAY